MKAKTILVVLLLLGSPVFADDKPKETDNATAVTGPTQPVETGVAAPKGEVSSVSKTEDLKDIESLKELDKKGLNWWQLLLEHLMELVFTLLGLMGTALVTVLFKKYKFQDHTERVNDLLDRAVGFAEQKSKKAAKLEGDPIGSAEKLEVAIQFAQSLAKEYKLPKKGKDWWEDKLEAWLGVTEKK